MRTRRSTTRWMPMAPAGRCWVTRLTGSTSETRVTSIISARPLMRRWTGIPRATDPDHGFPLHSGKAQGDAAHNAVGPGLWRGAESGERRQCATGRLQQYRQWRFGGRQPARPRSPWPILRQPNISTLRLMAASPHRSSLRLPRVRPLRQNAAGYALQSDCRNARRGKATSSTGRLSLP